MYVQRGAWWLTHSACVLAPGLFSAQSELRSISALGIFTWNSFRIVDWVCSLPEIDHERIGVTGASGGGT